LHSCLYGRNLGVVAFSPLIPNLSWTCSLVFS
jgi:hypothetical protein